MKRTLVAILTISIVGVVCVSAFGADDEAALIALDKKWGDANVKGDVAVLDEIYADNVILLGGQGLATKKQALDGAKNNAGKTSESSYTTSDFKVIFIDANTAVMTHNAVSKGVRDGKPFENPHRSMHVFTKRNGRWQVIANAGVPMND